MTAKLDVASELTKSRKKGQEFSSEAKVAMMALLDTGLPQTAVAQKFNTSRQAVSRIQKRWKKERTIQNRPRIGRPEKLTAAEKQSIIQLTKTNPEISYKELISETGGCISENTLRSVSQSQFKRK